jgi:hypothetical protein
MIPAATVIYAATAIPAATTIPAAMFYIKYLSNTNGT